MTPLEIRTRLAALQKKAGGKAEVYFSASGHSVSCTVYPDGLCGTGQSITYRSDPPADETFAEILAGIEAKWEIESARAHAELIRQIALAIIDLTDEDGACPDYKLRMKFSDADVARFGEAAIEEANKLAGRGPFSISRSDSNGAPRMEAAE